MSSTPLDKTSELGIKDGITREVVYRALQHRLNNESNVTFSKDIKGQKIIFFGESDDICRKTGRRRLSPGHQPSHLILELSQENRLA